jgi:NADH dehydrogenase/NADH:ubiquinone oxidoreductase subunit G
MTIWWLILILAAIGSIGIAFVWLAVRIGAGNHNGESTPELSLNDIADNSIKNIFSDDFREELRNRGRLHFEKIIGENAMFLQQDLRLTTSELNEYMKTEITRTLKEEFQKYEQSIMDAKQLATEAIQKTNTAIDEQRQILNEQLQKAVTEEKTHTLDRFDNNMADIINHYVLDAVGDQIDLNDQLEYILGSLNDNKAAIIEDIKSGA